MIWTTNFGRTSILEGVLVWYGGNQMIIHFFKTSEVADILFIIFFKSILWKMASAGRNWTKLAPQTAATTFCLLFCIYPSSILYVWHRRTNCQPKNPPIYWPTFFNGSRWPAEGSVGWLDGDILTCRWQFSAMAYFLTTKGLIQ